MSVGPTNGLIASAAGASYAQSQGSDVERVQSDISAAQRGKENQRKSEAAAGVGATDGENHETNERDADGRRPWEWDGSEKQQTAVENPATGTPIHVSRDATGLAGNQVDLSA